MSEVEGGRRIHMRSGVWSWEVVDPEPDLELDTPHLKLSDPDEPDNEMRVVVDGDPEEMSEDALERAAARPFLRLWLDRQGVRWVVWPPENPGVPEVEGVRGGAGLTRTLTFETEDLLYDTPAPRPLGELKDEELQRLLDAEREAEAGVEEEWLGEEW